MPIYEYYCPKCHQEFELMRLFSGMDKPAHCPTCGTNGERLVSACASKIGFYIQAPSSHIFRKPATTKRKRAAAKTLRAKSKRRKTK